jgi:hypothetical protein
MPSAGSNSDTTTAHGTGGACHPPEPVHRPVFAHVRARFNVVADAIAQSGLDETANAFTREPPFPRAKRASVLPCGPAATDTTVAFERGCGSASSLCYGAAVRVGLAGAEAA